MALRALLNVLVKEHTGIPTDHRTLLRTPRSMVVHKLGSGSFMNSIRRPFRNSFDVASSKLELQLHIDGLALFNSFRKQLWPIRGCTISPPVGPLLIAVYEGNSKPDINQYLKLIVRELKDISLMFGSTALYAMLPLERLASK